MMLAFGCFRKRPLAAARIASRSFYASRLLADAKLPESTSNNKSLLSNDLSSRIPKFPFHKDLEPSLIPRADSPRVSENYSFRQLMDNLRTKQTPELLYMAESHRLYFIACFAMAFVAAYNLFDMLTMLLPAAYEAYKEDIEEEKEENEQGAEPADHLMVLLKRFGLVAAMSGIYLFTSIFFTTFPSRLVRRIEFDPITHMCRLVTHPLIPGRPSPVINVPLSDLYLAARAKVWTGDGFYGATSKSSFFFFLWEKNRKLPWIVDRSGYFWGDARVYDVIFGKEPIAIAERGLSYDDGLKKQMVEAEKRRAELRRELGPAWRFKAQGQLMLEDINKFSEKGKQAVLKSIKSSNNKKLK